MLCNTLYHDYYMLYQRIIYYSFHLLVIVIAWQLSIYQYCLFTLPTCFLIDHDLYLTP